MFDQQFWIRTATGLTLAALVILLTLAGPLPASLLILLITAGSVYEFFRMRADTSDHRSLLLCCLTMLPVIIWMLVYVLPLRGIPTEGLVAPGLFAMLAIIFFIVRVPAGVQAIISQLESLGLGVLLFTIPGMFAISIAQATPKLLCGTFFLIWGSDVFAYLGGRAFGRHPLAREISPKKTWEGFVSGIVATAVAAYLMSQWIPEVSSRDWVISGILVVVFGTAGDLMQSVIKRSSGVKDSGRLLPGHGGIWDRFDSFLGCITWIGMYFLIVS